jgi:hypothetical protein
VLLEEEKKIFGKKFSKSKLMSLRERFLNRE